MMRAVFEFAVPVLIGIYAVTVLWKTPRLVLPPIPHQSPLATICRSSLHQTQARLERSCGTSPNDWMRLAPSQPGLERIEAFFAGHTYEPHRHDTYAIGYTMHGVQWFDYRGARADSTRGNLIVPHPHEVDDGRAGTKAGFHYRMVYIEPCLIRAALGKKASPCLLCGPRF